MRKAFFLVLIGMVCGLGASAQKVTVSKEVNVRSDYGYDIIGPIDDRMLLFRDQEDSYAVEVFDMEMTHILSRDIEMESRRTDLLGTIQNDTSWVLYYIYREGGEDLLRQRRLNKNGDTVDTLTIAKLPKKYGRDKTYLSLSQDESKALFFSRESDKVFQLILLNTESDTVDIVWKKSLLVKDYNLKKDFRACLVSNHGSVHFILESNEHRKNHHFAIIHLNGEESSTTSKLYFGNLNSQNLHGVIDNFNRRLIIAGLYNDRYSDHSEGYYYYNQKLSDIPELDTLTKVNWGLEFLAELYGKRIGKEKELKNHSLQHVIPRRDGGVLLLTEMNKIYNRRSAFGGSSTYRGRFAGRGWTDFYNEDMILMAIHPDGEQHWKTILYKKQFSQDDDAMYSGYFLFKTPSRLKLLYNDEIKKNNTVSEYLIDPLGNYNRNSVLSTEYQKLKLRFKDAVQVSNTALIVPSERNFNLSLVKIDFGA